MFAPNFFANSSFLLSISIAIIFLAPKYFNVLIIVNPIAPHPEIAAVCSFLNFANF